MAFADLGSIGAVGSTANNQASLVLTTTATCAVGELVVVVVAADNFANGGDDLAVSGVQNSGTANTWVKAIQIANAVAAQGGASCSIWYTNVTTAIASGATITATFTNANNTDASALTARHYSKAAGTSAVIEGTPGTLVNNTGADPGSLNVTTANIACLRVRGLAVQVGNNTNLTATSTWTAWANGNSATTGTTGEMCARAEHLISTATGAASDPTYVSAIYASAYVAFKEATLVNVTNNLATVSVGSVRVPLADAWSAVDKGSQITLSGNDKISQSIGSGGVRSTTTYLNGTAGKYYSEILITSAGAFNFEIGITPTSNTLTAVTSNMFIDEAGAVIVNGSTLVTLSAPVTTNVICIAWDAGAERIWFRINGGNWNNSGTADPATNTGGLDCSFAASTAHALWCTHNTGSMTITIRTELADYTQAVPSSGFTSWMGELPPQADAWNSADKSANIALSNVDKTATWSTGGLAGVRSTTAWASGTAGKFYAEFVEHVAGASAGLGAGFLPTADALTSNTNQVSHANANGNILIGSTVLGNIGTTVANDVICMAWDAGAEQVWFRKNAGNWNGSGTANPATGVGGFDVSATPNANVALVVSGTIVSTSVTVRTEIAEFTQAVPSGFTSWMGESAGGVNVNADVTTNLLTTAVGQVTVTAAVNVSVPVGTAPWTPAELGADLTVWYDFADTATVSQSGGFLTSWGDKSGNSRTGTPGNSTAFTINSDGIYIANATSGSGLVIQMPTLPSAYFDLAFAGKPNAFGSYRTLLANAAGSYHHVLLETGTNNLGSYSGALGFFQAGSLTWPSVDGQVYYSGPSATAIKIGRDGNSPLDETGENFTPEANPALMNYGSAGGQGWGTAREYVFMTAGRSQAVQEQVSGYLAWKWDGILGITTHVTALPGGHPYKSAAPTIGSALVLTTSVGQVTVDIVAGSPDVDVDVLGQQIAVSVGQADATGKANVDVLGNQVTASVGTPDATGKARADVLTNLATVLVGQVTIVGKANVDVLGNQVTATVGTGTTIVGKANVSILGLFSTALVGDATATGAGAFNGFDVTAGLLLPISFEGDNTGNATINTTAAFAYAKPAGYADWLPPTAVNVNADVLGQSLAVSVGQVTVVGKANVDVLGQQLTTTAGQLTVTGKANVDVTTNLLTTTAGQVTVVGKAVVNVTGQQIAVSVGKADTPVTGQQITTAVGTVSVVGKAIVNVTGLPLTVSVGKVDTPVTGQQLTVSVGTPTVSLPKRVDVLGQQLTVSVGTPTVSLPVQVQVLGQQIAVSVGLATVSLPKQAQVLGQQLTTAVGDVSTKYAYKVDVLGQQLVVSTNSVGITAGGSITVPVTGQQVTVSVGDISTKYAYKVDVLGQQLTTSVGQVTVVGKANVDVLGQLLTVSTGLLSASGKANVDVLGQLLTTSVGLASVSVRTVANVLGQQLAVSVGQVTVVGKANVDVLGQQVAVSVGQVTATAGGSGTANVLGQQLTVAVGQVSVVGKAIVNVLGQQLAVSVGKADTPVKGQQLTTAVGQVTAVGKARVDVIGQELTVAAGQLSVVGKAIVNVLTNLATVSVGQVSAGVRTIANVLGLQLTTAVGQVSVVGKAIVNVLGQSLTVSVGTAVGSIPKQVSVLGQQLTTSVGQVTVVGKANVDVTGQQLVTSTGTILVSANANVSVTGQQLTTSVGKADTPVKGQGVTVSLGTVTVATQSGINVTGQAVTAFCGTVTVAAQTFGEVYPEGQELRVDTGQVFVRIGEIADSTPDRIAYVLAEDRSADAVAEFRIAVVAPELRAVASTAPPRVVYIEADETTVEVIDGDRTVTSPLAA